MVAQAGREDGVVAAEREERVGSDLRAGAAAVAAPMDETVSMGHRGRVG